MTKAKTDTQVIVLTEYSLNTVSTELNLWSKSPYMFARKIAKRFIKETRVIPSSLFKSLNKDKTRIK